MQTQIPIYSKDNEKGSFDALQIYPVNDKVSSLLSSESQKMNRGVIKEEEVRGVEVLNVSTVLVTLNVSSKRMSIGSLLAELQRLSVQLLSLSQHKSIEYDLRREK